MVTYSLRLPTFKLRCLAADILAAMSIISARGHQLVLDGFSDFKITYTETFRFEWLVSSLEAFIENDTELVGLDEASILWEWRTAVLGLMNALTAGEEDLESRCDLRQEFRRRGLDHALEVSSL
jgi:hypothetical protein